MDYDSGKFILSLFSKHSKLFVCNEGELKGIDTIKRYLILFKVSLNLLVDAFTKVLVLSWCLHCTPWYLRYYGIKTTWTLYSMVLNDYQAISLTNNVDVYTKVLKIMHHLDNTPMYFQKYSEITMVNVIIKTKQTKKQMVVLLDTFELFTRIPYYHRLWIFYFC